MASIGVLNAEAPKTQDSNRTNIKTLCAQENLKTSHH